MNSQSALERARELRKEAANEKRLSGVHRRNAQRKMEELRAFCEQVGIELTVVVKGDMD